MLRGLGREQDHWGAFSQELRKRMAAGDTVLAHDLPGNGVRCREASPLTVMRMTEAARLGLQALRCGPPYVLLGLSLGGMVALDWAARYPGEAQACVLVNTSSGTLSPPWERLRPSAYPALLRWILPGSRRCREKAVLDATSNRPVDPGVLQAWTDIAARHPVSRLNVARQVVAAARFRSPARNAVPKLLLASRGDRVVSPRCSEAMARAWDLPLHEHPWAGHDLPLDDPSWLAERIARWAAQGFA